VLDVIDHIERLAAHGVDQDGNGTKQKPCLREFVQIEHPPKGVTCERRKSTMRPVELAFLESLYTFFIASGSDLFRQTTF
jgi:hypothetical protein